MKRPDASRLVHRTAMIVLSAALGPHAAAHDAVQWQVRDGGNGHWYAIVIDPKANWEAGADAANAVGAHLATIGSGAENAFVHARALATPGAFTQVDFGPYLGGRQDGGGSAFVEPAGGWVWTTGEPWNYANWLGTEPNDFECFAGAPSEDFLQLYRNGMWNDAAAQPDACAARYAVSYAFEWSADCDGDGVVDYGQIASGERVDADGNGVPDCCDAGALCDPCAASDVIQNGLVDAIDLSAVVNAWNTDGGSYPRADIDRNGIVNGVDLGILLSNWGVCR